MAQKTDRDDIVLEHYQPLLFQILILQMSVLVFGSIKMLLRELWSLRAAV